MPINSSPLRFSLAALGLFIAGLAGGCAFCPSPPPPAAAPPSRIAAWVVRSEIDSPAKIERLCAAAKASGLDELLVQVRGRADAYYQSELAPRAEALAGEAADFDPLAAVLAACAPIPVHAWLNVYYLWGGDTPPTDPAHPGHPGQAWLLANAEGRSTAELNALERAQGWLEGAFADPADPAYRRLFVEVVKELAANYPLAGIHLDFVRYPGPAYGQSGPLGRRFREEWGIDPALLPESIAPEEIRAWLNREQPPAERLLTTAALLWAARRADQITALVAATGDALHRQARPTAAVPLLSAAVLPDPADAVPAKGQEWPHWLAAGLVDRVYPMTYFGEPARVAAQLAQIARLQPNPAQVWVGLGAYLKNPEQIGMEAAAARRAGFPNLALFSLGHLMAKPTGAAPYVQALREFVQEVSGREEVAEPPPEPVAEPTPESATRLARLLRHALGPAAAADRLAATIAERLAELQKSRRLLTETLEQLAAASSHPAPAWIEGREFFRFIHPLDPPERRQAQVAECEQTRQQLLAGADFSALAQARSQGGSRRFGGLLPRRWLDPADPGDRRPAELKPGEISPLEISADGCRLHLIEAKGNGEPVSWEQLPLASRRLLFKQKLTELLLP